MKTKKIQARAEIEVPRVPNFLLMTDGQKLPLCAVPDEDLRRIGELWTISLLERSKEQKKVQAEYK